MCLVFFFFRDILNQAHKHQAEASKQQKSEVNGYKKSSSGDGQHSRSRSHSPEQRTIRRDVKKMASPDEKLTNQKESKIQYDLAETEDPIKASPLRVPEKNIPEKKTTHSRSTSSSSSRSGSVRSRSRSYSSDSSSASSKNNEKKPAKKVEVSCLN
jgi:hypothetical protein